MHSFITSLSWLATRAAIVSLRSKVQYSHLSQPTRDVIRQLGIRRGGCRGGSHYRRHVLAAHRVTSSLTADVCQQTRIATIVGNRSDDEPSRRRDERNDGFQSRVTVARPRVLTDVKVTPLTSTTFRTARIYNYVPPTLYVLNAAAITKPHAVDHIAADMRGYNVDVAIITETHLKRKHADHIVSVDGYTLFRRDRAGRRGGGVAVYVSSRLRASLWTSVRDHPDYELLWVRVQSDTYSAVIGALYHPHKSIYVVQDLLSHIDECLEAIANDMPSVLVVLAGDFNALRDCLLYTSDAADE